MSDERMPLARAITILRHWASLRQRCPPPRQARPAPTLSWAPMQRLIDASRPRLLVESTARAALTRHIDPRHQSAWRSPATGFWHASLARWGTGRSLLRLARLATRTARHARACLAPVRRGQSAPRLPGPPASRGARAVRSRRTPRSRRAVSHTGPSWWSRSKKEARKARPQPSKPATGPGWPDSRTSTPRPCCSSRQRQTRTIAVFAHSCGARSVSSYGGSRPNSARKRA